MRLLLDTHIWLWSLLEPGRLASRISKALQNPANELWLSPVSAWETVLLHEKGRIALQPDATSWISTSFAAVPLREAPLTHDIAMATGALTLPHRDPADRLLAATAKVLDLTLVTADQNLLSGRGYSVLANR
jgi:PIN domain nuclease of toxin-antitoxin system